MKNYIIFLFLSIALSSQAQYFNNVNNELCYELYTVTDPMGEYRVYVVVDPENFTQKDSLMLTKMDGMSQGSKSVIAQRWAMEGKRIEAERAPYITKPPVFPKPIGKIDMRKLDHKIDWENSPWKDAKPFWQHKDRPF
jgi:hypothetical protein